MENLERGQERHKTHRRESSNTPFIQLGERKPTHRGDRERNRDKGRGLISWRTDTQSQNIWNETLTARGKREVPGRRTPECNESRGK